MQSTNILRDYRKMNDTTQADFAATLFGLLTDEEKHVILHVMEQIAGKETAQQ